MYHLFTISLLLCFLVLFMSFFHFLFFFHSSISFFAHHFATIQFPPSYNTIAVQGILTLTRLSTTTLTTAATTTTTTTNTILRFLYRYFIFKSCIKLIFSDLVFKTELKVNHNICVELSRLQMNRKVEDICIFFNTS